MGYGEVAGGVRERHMWRKERGDKKRGLSRNEALPECEEAPESSLKQQRRYRVDPLEWWSYLTTLPAFPPLALKHKPKLRETKDARALGVKEAGT